MGPLVNFTNAINSVNTEYLFLMGGHDILEPNYIADCFNALKEHNAIHAYGNVKMVNSDYSFNREYTYYYSDKLLDDNPCVRVTEMCKNLGNCTCYNGLYKTYALKKATNVKYASKYMHLDNVVLVGIVKIGKSALQNKSKYIRMIPREEEPLSPMWKRAVGNSFPNKKYPPTLMPVSIYIGQVSILNSLIAKNEEDKQIIKETKQILFERWGGYFSNSKKPLIDTIAWWMPIKKWREKFRNYILD